MFNSIKKISFLVFALILVSRFSYSQDEHSKDHDKMKEEMNHKSDEPAGIKMSDGILYGKDYDPGMAVIEFADLLKNASDNNDKVIVVKGNVSEVCQEMGCWMVMSEGSDNVRVKTLHEFFLPKDAAGNNAVVIGKFKITEISEEQARHYNEEAKNPKIKTDDIKGPQKVYEIDALGIKILNPVNSNKN